MESLGDFGAVVSAVEYHRTLRSLFLSFSRSIHSRNVEMIESRDEESFQILSSERFAIAKEPNLRLHGGLPSRNAPCSALCNLSLSFPSRSSCGGSQLRGGIRKGLSRRGPGAVRPMASARDDARVAASPSQGRKTFARTCGGRGESLGAVRSRNRKGATRYRA